LIRPARWLMNKAKKAKMLFVVEEFPKK
jgi:hypothetical protein